MPALAQIRTDVDSWLTAHWPAFQAKQATFFGNRGRYWQGLVTHSAPPADGGLTAPDQAAAKPYYEVASWADQSWLDPTMEFALACDAYDGPLGQGYVAHCYVTVAGTTYHRAQNVGPETWRTQGWAPVVGVP